eukprot:s1054_g19.t1
MANRVILISFPQVSLTSARQNTAARQKQQKSSTLRCSLPLELALLDSKTAIPMLHNQKENTCGHFISHASKEKPLVGFGTGDFVYFTHTGFLTTRTSHLLKLIIGPLRNPWRLSFAKATNSTLTGQTSSSWLSICRM